MTKTEVHDLLLKEENLLKKQKLQELLDKMAFFEHEERPLIDALNGIGVKVDSVWDLVNNRPHPHLKSNFTGNYDIAYPVLVEHLDYSYHPRVKEGIVRALTEKNASKVATDKILELFYKESDKSLKWAMANALQTLMTRQKRLKYPEIKEVLDGL